MPCGVTLRISVLHFYSYQHLLCRILPRTGQPDASHGVVSYSVYFSLFKFQALRANVQ